MLLVFGSINLDIAFHATRLPGPGETVLGRGYLVSPGGKGANQAHAAARFGMPTQLVGAVGDDAFAEAALDGLGAAGVGLDHLRRLPGATGCANIVVDAAGENQIVVAPGANASLRHGDVSEALLSVSEALLVQMECDVLETQTLLARARQRRCLTVLNNAPAQLLDETTLRNIDVLIVNQGELRRTGEGIGIKAKTAPPQQLQQLAKRFGLRVVLTLGGRGVLACESDGQLLQMPALAVEVRDSTGAGDTFAGVLTAALIEGKPLRSALAFASVAAGLACRHPGARIAQPSRDDVEAALGHYWATLGPAA
ncbi:MAG: ribokinase [Burkholderiaceae bacterium]